MQLVKVSVGFLTLTALAVMPAGAGQRGHGAVAAHPAPKVHAAGNGVAHSARVPVVQRVTSNPALVARLQPLLPSGMTLAAAAEGFKSEGQLIATLHAAQNLKIPFAQLKAEMIGADHDSLGQAIHDLQPAADAKAAAHTAAQEARADIKATKPPKTGAEPFVQRITGNQALVARLQPLLPVGMTLASAADGFRNEGQFIAALHLAKNLNIPFAQLKAEIAGADHDSLGQALRDLRPTANVKTAVETAEQEARADVRATAPPKTTTDKADR